MTAIEIAVARPSLESGDRMDRAEFHRRYSCRPDLKKAELVDGVVYVASPVRSPQHGLPHSLLQMMLGPYVLSRRDVVMNDNTSWLVDETNEVQPDVMLFRRRSAGGTAYVGADDFLHGVPELVAEIAGSSYAIDLGRKRDMYRRAGVREYVVWETESEVIHWWRLEAGEWVAIEPGADGLLHSTVFEGLSLDPAELIRLAREKSSEQ